MRLAKDVAGTEQLAAALIARAVPRSGGVAWEYYFPYGGGRAPWVSGMAQAVAAQALLPCRSARDRRVHDVLARGRRGVRHRPAADDEGRGRTLDPALLLQLDGGAERAAAVGAVARDVCEGVGRLCGRDARLANGAGGRRERLPVRHRLLDVLLARRRPHSALVPEVHRPAPAPARPRRRAVCGCGRSLCGVPAGASRLQARERLRRDASLLALEAGFGQRIDTGWANGAARPPRRLAHASLARAEARRVLRDPRDRRRLGGQPCLVHRAADRPRPNVRAAVDRRAAALGSRRPHRHAATRHRCRDRRLRPGDPRGLARLSASFA